MLKIWSTAVTHGAPSLTQVLIDKSGCVFCGGGQASILGARTLTLLPFSVTASLVTCLLNYSFNPCHFLLSLFLHLQASRISLHTAPPLQPPTRSLTVFPAIIMLKVALSASRSPLSPPRRPAVCAFTCFVKIISFPTRSRQLCLPARLSAHSAIAQSVRTTAGVCACEKV